MFLFKYALIIIIVSSYFVGHYLPLSWGWENSPLEWSQVVILFVGALLTLKWRLEFKSARQYHYARFFTWAIPLWLLMAGREMSWGRVFYPVGINPITGPFFIPVSQLPYGPIVYPLIAVAILLWMFAVIKYKLFLIPYKLYQQGRFPTSEFLLVIFAFAVAHIAERQLDFEIMEEIAETVAYISLLITAYRVKVALKNPVNITGNFE